MKKKNNSTATKNTISFHQSGVPTLSGEMVCILAYHADGPGSIPGGANQGLS